MLIRAVLDVAGGRVVRAVGGRREAYRPWRPAWCPSADPLAFARAARDRWGVRHLYLADLDALAGTGPRDPAAHRGVWDDLLADGFDLLADAGTRVPGDGDFLRESGLARWVAASEAVRDNATLRDLLALPGAVGGWDLRAGATVGPAGCGAVLRAHARELLVLDVAAVGGGGGVPTLRRCRSLLGGRPGQAVLTGGGVRGVADVRAAAAAGVSELLVATALDDGRLDAANLRPWLAP